MENSPRYEVQEVPMPKERNGTTYLSVGELADVLGVHRNTILYWIGENQLKAVRSGLAKKSPWLIPEEEVERIKEKLGM